MSSDHESEIKPRLSGIGAHSEEKKQKYPTEVYALLQSVLSLFYICRCTLPHIRGKVEASVALNVWFPVVGEREREKNAVTSNRPRQWNVKKKGNKPAFVDILTRQ